jgi:hypothetical protein
VSDLWLGMLRILTGVNPADGNHCGLWSEEISPAGEGLGNAVQGFTVCIEYVTSRRFELKRLGDR